MITFYVTRLKKLTTNEERIEYLNTTVVSSKRKEVLDTYNSENPDDPIILED